jgi:hypothetical protein
MIKMCGCRVIHGFGPKDYVLFNFYNKPFSVAKNYLKKEELEAIQRKVNKEEARELVENKIEFYLHCRQHDLPTPEILAVVGESLECKYQQRIKLVKDVEALKGLIRSRGAGRYLLKPISGSHGSGLVRLTYNAGEFLNDDGEPFAFCIIFDCLSTGISYLLQHCLIPHEKIQQVMPGGSLGTARIVTIKSRQGLKIFNPCLRIPLGCSINDNFIHGTSRNLAAGIDLASGCLLNPYGADSQGLNLVIQLNSHPESGFEMKDFKLPYWQDMLKTVSRASSAFGDLTTIGWDVALTENGPCLIEGNWRYDCALLQLAFDKGIKPVLPRLLTSA